MSQKVWVIPDPYWDKTPEDNRVSDRPEPERLPPRIPVNGQDRPGRPQKNPAWSFSFSLFIWGSGQLQIRAYGPGALFLGSMLLFYAGIISVVLFRDFILQRIPATEFSPSGLVIGFLIFVMTALFLWGFNAADAYFRTARLRSEPYRGVEREIWPLLCSLCFPGWGQFVNGQPKKGLFFLFFGVMGIFALSVPIIAGTVWPLLDTRHDRIMLEITLAAALAVIPCFFLMWLVSAYDAFRSSRAGRRRSQFPNGRPKGRGEGLVQEFPRVTAILSLLLAISVGMQLWPKGYYLDSLERIRTEMLSRNMEILPEMVRKAMAVVDR